MAIMKKPSNELPKDFVSQAKETLSAEAISTETPKIPAAAVKPRPVIAATAETTESKTPSGKYSDVINLKLPKGERNRLKGLCAQFGISMNQFILYSIYELEEKIMDGKCTVSQMGVRNLE